MSIRTSSLVLLLLATLQFAQPARADSVSVVYHFSINYVGDNASGYITGPGTLIGTGGSTDCTWCFAGTPILPGTTLNASVHYLDFGSYFTGTFMGATIDPYNFSMGSTSITAGSFTLPPFEKDGKFSITLPASMGIIHVFDGTQTRALEVRPGQLRLTFLFGYEFNPQDQVYVFQSAQYTSSVTPEPQTLILLGSGVLMIAGTSFRKFREQRHRA